MPIIQKSVTCESIKDLGPSRFNLSRRLSVTLDISLAKHRAESNSNVGMVKGFKGVDIQVFDTTKWEYAESSSSSTRYTTVA